jgi:hypothetical protein
MTRGVKNPINPKLHGVTGLERSNTVNESDSGAGD